MELASDSESAVNWKVGWSQRSALSTGMMPHLGTRLIRLIYHETALSHVAGCFAALGGSRRAIWEFCTMPGTYRNRNTCDRLTACRATRTRILICTRPTSACRHYKLYILTPYGSVWYPGPQAPRDISGPVRGKRLCLSSHNEEDSGFLFASWPDVATPILRIVLAEP